MAIGMKILLWSVNRLVKSLRGARETADLMLRKYDTKTTKVKAKFKKKMSKVKAKETKKLGKITEAKATAKVVKNIVNGLNV